MRLEKREALKLWLSWYVEVDGRGITGLEIPEGSLKRPYSLLLQNFSGR